MGQVTITKIRRSVAGNRRKVTFTITMSNSYASGGDTIAVADIQSLLQEYRAPTTLNVVDLFDSEIALVGGIDVSLDRANALIKAWNGTTQIGNGTDLSASSLRAAIEYGDEPSSTT